MRLTEQGLMHTQDGVLETWPEHVLIMIGKQKVSRAESRQHV
jgi:hypothetical protein